MRQCMRHLAAFIASFILLTAGIVAGAGSRRHAVDDWEVAARAEAIAANEEGPVVLELLPGDAARPDGSTTNPALNARALRPHRARVVPLANFRTGDPVL